MAKKLNTGKMLAGWLIFISFTALVYAGDKDKNFKPFVVATDYPSLQDAIDALPKRGGTVYLPSGNYLVTETLNLTGRTTTPTSETFPHGGAFFRLVGEGRKTVISGDTKGKPVIDMAFSAYAEISNLKIASRSANVGILLGREKEGGGSAGGNMFQNISIEMSGPEAKACVYSMGSEVNRFINCHFSIYAHNGTAFYFTPRNPLDIKSPYLPAAGGGCNTELAFYGCQFANRGVNSVGLKIEAFSANVRLYAGYFSNQGFAAIYLDGTKACLDSVGIYDVRIEGEWGKHCLYAKGYTRNIAIRGGTWHSGWGEAICYEAADTWNDSKGEAYNWNIEQANMSLAIGHAQKHRGGKIVYWEGFEQEIPFYKKQEGEDFYTLVRFFNLRNSTIDLRFYAVPIYWEEETKDKTKFRYASNIKAIVVDNLSQGNNFIGPKRDLVLLKKENVYTGNKMTALDDDGKYALWHQKGEMVSLAEEGNMRTYLIGNSYLNLTPQPASSIKNPKKGDFALDNTDGKLRLGVYDGERWLYSDLKEEK